MLILPRSVFLHVPKTGGSWVRKAIEAAGVPCTAFSLGSNHHPGLKDCPAPEKFKFAFVRHPVSLYRSYWQYKMTYGWDPLNDIDNHCKSTDFPSFVRNVASTFPGAYGKNLDEIVGKPDRQIEFVGKYENLREDLVTALQLAQEDFDEAIIRNLPPYNVSDKKSYPAVYTDELRALVCEVEAEVLQRFNYAAG